MESVLDKMTNEQRKILEQFKLNLEDVLNPTHTDELLVKFLRAKNYDIKASEKIFRENYHNRITFGVNTIVDTYEKPEVAQKYENAAILGFAKDGTLIRYIAAGRLDFYGFIMSMSCADLCLYFSHMMENDKHLLEQENLKTGKNITEITFIFDLEGFTIQQVLHKNVMEMCMDYTRLLQDCYPEIWRNVFLVNAPKVFDKAFNLFKPVIRAQVFDRIQVISKDATKAVLLKYIDEDVLPAFLGGHRVDSNGDPMCKELICFTGKVPEKFYSQYVRIPLSPTDSDVKCFVVGPRSIYNYCTLAKEPGTKFRFQGRSEGGSIYISVLYKELDPDPDNTKQPGENEYIDVTAKDCEYTQISVELRAQMHCTQEDVTISLPRAGLYILRFNNSNSWFTSRKIYAKGELFPPKTQSPR